MTHRMPTDAPLGILMIAPQYRPLVGGYERAAERLSAALVGRGHNVTVIADRRDLSWPKRELHNGVFIQRLWCLFKPKLHMPTSLASLAWFLIRKGRRFDVWHVHQYGLHAAVAIGLGRLLGRPTVLKLTSSGQQGVARAMGGHPLAWLVTHLLARASGIVALTRETASEALAVGIPAARIHRLGNGVDTVSFQPRTDADRRKAKQAVGLEGRSAVLYVGRLSPEKNVEGLIRSWAEARPSMPPGWALVVIGEGPSRAQMEVQIDLTGLTGEVMVAGEQANIETWMAAADVYVSSSLWEGLSNTLLEAMSCGLPVAVTRVSGVTELVEDRDAGLVVEVGDDGALASALVRLAQDPHLRRRLGKAARLSVERTYSLEAVADRHETLYRRLMAERTS